MSLDVDSSSLGPSNETPALLYLDYSLLREPEPDYSAKLYLNFQCTETIR
jgi:hypothetical protein